MRLLDQVASWSPRSAAAIVAGGDVVALHGDRDEPFRLASVTKLLVAHAFSVALEEGAVALDDVVDSPAPTGATWRHLLSHAGGLPFDGREPIAPPGTRRIYSNSGWTMAANHLERSTSIGIGEYLHEAVCQPLELRHTSLQGNAGRDATGSVGDLARFAMELLRPGLVDPSTHHRAIEVHFPGLGGVLPGVGRFDRLDWGLGYQLASSGSMVWAGRSVSPSTYGHFGAYGTFVWVDPDRQLAVIALGDRDFGDWALTAWPTLGDAVIAAFDAGEPL